MRFVDSGNARIHWEAEGQGTPVLLIMGHLYSARMWRPLLPALTESHRAITFDNRGVGESSVTPTATIAEFAADALAVLDAAGVQRAHVYGVSMGGGIAAEFAMRYPERTASLILGCTRMKTEPGPKASWVAQLLYRLPHGLVRALLLSRMSAAAYGSAAPADAVARDMQVLREERFTVRGVAVQSAAIAAYVTTPEAVGQLRMPVLVLHGDEDQAVAVEHGRAFAAAVPHSRLTIFEGAGHNYLVAAGAKATAAVLDFLAEVDRGAGPGAR